MKKFILFLLVCFICIPLGMAQDKFVAAGGGFGDKGFGWAGVGIPLTDSTLSYTLMDFTPTSSVEDASFSLLNNRVLLKMTTTQGIAQRLLQLTDKLSLWAMGAAGVATTGEDTSFAAKYGGFGDYRIKPKWGIMVGFGGQYDSLNNNSLDLRLGVNYYLGK